MATTTLLPRVGRLNSAKPFQALYLNARVPEVEPFEVLAFNSFDQTPSKVAFNADICENV